ncbi:MAG: YifB family Mg chelatase-like AAA ATPase [Sulfurimonas sp.]|nr:YifB family Mg chelatase-like AAA ATPase [Sulfurimonadaceae bacterium]
MKRVFCATYEGLDAKVVEVESTLTKGLPSFSIVGMASASISEAKDRVKSALLCNNFVFPPKRITINLAPSDIKKEGSHFDLSIALLIALDNLEDDFSEWFVFGELGLDGAIKSTQGLYPLLLSLANQDVIKKAIVPYESLDKLSNIPNIELYGIKSLSEAIELLSSEVKEPTLSAKKMSHQSYTVGEWEYFFIDEYKEDFIDVLGQEVAKRAALISAAGFHNILLEGSPGCGKSMIASRLRYVLPPLNQKELLDIAKLDALDDKEPTFKPLRPFRSPHHTSTVASIFGGGSHKAKIGEVGLAHNGVLFFDELPHFSKSILEALREPLQDSKIRISRVNSKVEYPSDFLFVAAMNPCPCGNLLNEHLECRCNELEIKKYKNRLSDPFLDRIDLYVVMQQVSPDDKASVDSKTIHDMVKEVHKRQLSRGQKSFNAKLNDDEVERFCLLDDEAKTILDTAISRFALSFRTIKKLKKVARTIADLDGSKVISKAHLLEALSYRRR